MSEAKYVVVSIAYPSEQEAQVAASALVERRLAACGQISAIKSTYRWEGEVVTEPECLLTLKTSADCLDALSEFVRSTHSYEVCEIIATPALWVDAPYRAWLAENTQPE